MRILYKRHFVYSFYFTILGDRIAIINNGKLVSFGSSLFLRSRYGNGYYLTLVVSDGSNNEVANDEIETNRDEIDASPASKAILKEILHEEEDPEANKDMDIAIDDEGISDVAKVNGVVINPSRANENARICAITKFITRYVENAQLIEFIGSEVIYVLPQEKNRDFEAFFQALDAKMDALQIKSYGLSDTTLEEIFLKVASNIHDGEIVREIHVDDITDHGRFASRVRSASTRSGELNNAPILTSSQQKILGVGAKFESSNVDEEIVVNERIVSTPDGKEVTCKLFDFRP